MEIGYMPGVPQWGVQSNCLRYLSTRLSRCYIVKLCGCRAIGGSHMAPDITLYLTNWLAFDVKICSLAVLSTRYYILLKVYKTWMCVVTDLIHSQESSPCEVTYTKFPTWRTCDWLKNSLECDTQKASHLTMWPTTNFPHLSQLIHRTY